MAHIVPKKVSPCPPIHCAHLADVLAGTRANHESVVARAAAKTILTMHPDLVIASAAVEASSTTSAPALGSLTTTVPIYVVATKRSVPVSVLTM